MTPRQAVRDIQAIQKLSRDAGDRLARIRQEGYEMYFHHTILTPAGMFEVPLDVHMQRPVAWQVFAGNLFVFDQAGDVLAEVRAA